MSGLGSPAADVVVQAGATHTPQSTVWAGRQQAPLLDAALLALARDLQLAFRKRGQLVQPLAFFAMVTMLFPLAISPELSRLREIAPGVLWAGAVLASLRGSCPRDCGVCGGGQCGIDSHRLDRRGSDSRDQTQRRAVVAADAAV